MDFEHPNKYYLKTREDGAIIDAFSDGPHHERNTDGYILFGQGGYQLRLTINGKQTEENPNMYDMIGIPLYKWDGTQIVARTKEEIEADRAAIPPAPPSEQEQLRADVDFLLAIGGLL